MQLLLLLLLLLMLQLAAGGIAAVAVTDGAVNTLTDASIDALQWNH